jgi:hypothetical protein
LTTLQTIGKYRIDGVYKAWDADIARTVALKTIRRELLEGLQETELVARFRNEAQASGRLVHPNIVAVYDFGTLEGCTYIAMEFVDGTPLGAFLAKDAPMDVAASVRCIGQLLRALAYAHARGVVHRDIKPANILVTADAQVKITDFGIAKIESSTLTQVGAVIGTPSYMSPFSGAASVVMHQILHETPPDPSARNPGLHPAFDAVTARALAKRSEDRYPNAQAFYDALHAAQLQHNGGLPPTQEDDERTVLALQRPAQAAPARAAATQQSGVSTASNALTAGAPAWLTALAPDLQHALSTQIGPVARLVLKNAARDALDLDDLCARLLPHIGSDAGRAQFQDSVRDIKKQHGLATLGTMGARQTQATGGPTGMTGMPTLLQLSPELMDAAQHKLAVYVGPIARVLAKRAAKMTGNADEFYRLLADNLPDPQERARFLKEVGRG